MPDSVIRIPECHKCGGEAFYIIASWAPRDDLQDIRAGLAESDDLLLCGQCYMDHRSKET